MDNGSNAAGAAGAGIGGLLIGMLVGALVGGVVALLFAPQSGSQTRDMIKNRFGQMKEVVRGSAQDVGETAQKTADQMQ